MQHSRVWGLLLVAMVLLSLTTATVKGTPQFVPNGRYGRRSIVPPLAGVTSDMNVKFFGDSSITCSYTGFADIYRCSRRSSDDYKDSSLE
ncbi:RYamide neuropeptides-like [Ornithodoros turicata]|uniref:RYamide neuropeptides-like n=1 Tax=Ornithodoros turicata TaxID=34597 RepID=UPI00313A0E24